MKYAYSQREVTVPDKVTFKVDGKKIEMKGAKGTMIKDFSHAKNIDITSPAKGKILIECRFPRKADLAMLGTLEGHIKNMILGVTVGFKYKMIIAYSHFPLTVKVNKDILEITNYTGERGMRTVPIVGNVKVTATKDSVVIEGIDKDEVSLNAGRFQQAAKVRFKDRRVFQDGIFVYEKYAGDQLLWHVKT
ncbi:MAG: 50S ribosomal protein L6 [Candidatus Lokiarchaeota archaeon]|nr:50S ribosomal protein L6 [Candidatus Lokiarchaeota archaeon]